MAIAQKPEEERSPRVQRKREKARQRILEAAERLMEARDPEEVTIQDITQAADIGHGTFYTHFKTKMDVLGPIVEARAKRHTARLDILTADMENPAEVLAVSARHLLTAIIDDALWTWFLDRSALPADVLYKGMGRSAERDIRKGIELGKLYKHDEQVFQAFQLGAFVGVLRRFAHNKDRRDFIEKGTVMFLMVCGVTPEEAENLVAKPLPPLPELPED